MTIYAVCRRVVKGSGGDAVLFWGVKPYGNEELGLPSGGHRKLLDNHPYRALWVQQANAPELDESNLPKELTFIAPAVKAGPWKYMGDIFSVRPGSVSQNFHSEVFRPARDVIVQALIQSQKIELMDLFLGCHVCCSARRRDSFPSAEEVKRIL